MKTFTVVTVALLIPLTACGGDDRGMTTRVISGKVHVEDVMAVESVPVDGHASHGCTVEALKGKRVVVSDPDGKKVGVVDLPSAGIDDPLPAESADEFYGGVFGSCNLKFEITVKGQPGVYTAEIEGMPGTSTSFSDAKTRDVVIEVKS